MTKKSPFTSELRNIYCSGYWRETVLQIDLWDILFLQVMKIAQAVIAGKGFLLRRLIFNLQPQALEFYASFYFLKSLLTKPLSLHLFPQCKNNFFFLYKKKIIVSNFEMFHFSPSTSTYYIALLLCKIIIPIIRN